MGAAFEPDPSFSALADELGAIVFVTTLEARMLWANRSLTRETGFVAADFAFEQQDNPFVHPEDAPRVGKVLAAFVGSDASVSEPIENRFFDKWGRVHRYRSVARKTTWDGAPALLFVVRRADASAVPRATDESYRRIVEGASEGVVKLDAEGRVLFANAYLYALLGMSAVELAKESFFDRVGIEDRERTRRTLARVSGPVTFETRLLTASRETCWVEINASRLTESEDAGTLLLLVRDVSATRQMDAAMREAQKLESLGVLASGVAHDFRNLTSAVLSGIGAAEARAGAGSQVAEALGVAREAAERAAALTASLLGYVGRAESRVESLDVGVLARGHERLLRSLIPSHVALRLVLPPSPVVVAADGGQLAQVLLNLVINGAEAIDGPSGTVTVTVKALDVLADEDGWRPGAPAEGRYAALVVEDDGKGIAAGKIERVFDAFFTTKQSGRGLGLSAVMAVVRAQGGAIRVASEEGKGTTFIVLLGPAIERAASLPAPGKGSGCVLVADDEETLRRLGRIILEDAGYEVVTAETGAEALAVFEADPARFRAAVVDLRMPGLDGKALLAKLRAHKPELGAVLTSGNDAELGHGDPASVFLAKPYETEDLVRAVATVIDASSRRGA